MTCSNARSKLVHRQDVGITRCFAIFTNSLEKEIWNVYFYRICLSDELINAFIAVFWAVFIPSFIGTIMNFLAKAIQ